MDRQHALEKDLKYKQELQEAKEQEAHIMDLSREEAEAYMLKAVDAFVEHMECKIQEAMIISVTGNVYQRGRYEAQDNC
jgi:F0F1-type ATP synthase membrane subunit b/b'